MSNMSYCRFENTLNDLHDCHENMDNEEIEDGGREDHCRKQMIDLCIRIVEDYQHLTD